MSRETRRAIRPAAGDRPPRGDRLVWSVVGASGALVALTLFATRFVADPPGLPGGLPPGSRRSLPRVPYSPATTGEFLRTLGIGSLIWYSCFLSAPLFLWMSRRLRFDRRHWAPTLAAHVAVIAVLAALTAACQYQLTYGGAPVTPNFGAYVRLGIITGALPFLAIAAGAHALDARFRGHTRDLEAARMRSQLAESRLDMLTAQLQPHFLFNTLQGISTLITHDPAAADRLLNNLSDLLREVLRRGERREVPLAEELRVLEPYLAISRTRFGDRLSLSSTVDAGAERGLVPFFILQPLVENALRHGIESHAGRGSVAIHAERAGDALRLSVIDDGAGVRVEPRVDSGIDTRVDPHADAHATTGRGIGLANVSARLRALYGADQSIDVGRSSAGGFRVCVTLPYREPPRDAES